MSDLDVLVPNVGSKTPPCTDTSSSRLDIMDYWAYRHLRPCRLVIKGSIRIIRVYEALMGFRDLV